MGKTSLMREVALQQEDRYTCVFVDLQQACSAQDAIAELSKALHPHRSLWKRTTELFSNALARFKQNIDEVHLAEVGISLRADLTDGNWAHKGDQLFRILAAAERPVLLLMDEVPILVNRLLRGDDFAITPERRRKADEFMSWLRKNANAHQGTVRIVVSGSIGFEPILHQAQLSATINHFEPFDLHPWDDDTAAGCLVALAKQYGVELEAGVPELMVRRLGCNIPHHVQMFFHFAHLRCRRRGDARVLVEDVARIYRNDMLSVRGHAELTHYEDRLKLVLGPDRFPLATELLAEAAKVGVLSGEAIRLLVAQHDIGERDAMGTAVEILGVLEHDGYLRKHTDGHRFVSNLVRDWWLARYGHLHVPALQREA